MKVTELLDSPEKWTKGQLAKDVGGLVVGPVSWEAVCWCLVGAVHKCYPDVIHRIQVMDNIAVVVLRRKGLENLLAFNDAPETTYEDVIALCTEAGV